MKHRLVSNIEGHCSCCNSDDIEWGGADYWDGGVSYFWTCNECGAEGRADYVHQFAGNCVDLEFKDKYGNAFYDYIDVEEKGIKPDQEGEVFIDEQI